MWAFCLWGLLNRVRSICECVGLDRRFECVLVQSALFGPRAYDGRTSATLRSVFDCALWAPGEMWASVLLTWV